MVVRAKDKIIKQRSSEVMSGSVILDKVFRVGLAVKMKCEGLASLSSLFQVVI